MTSAALLQSREIETYKKKYLTGKISKIDKELKYLDNLVPNGIVKDCLKDEMTSKKKSFSKMFTQNVKRQKILNQPKAQDQKVNAISQYICLKILQRSCMRSLSHNYVYKMPDKIAQNILYLVQCCLILMILLLHLDHVYTCFDHLL